MHTYKARTDNQATWDIVLLSAAVYKYMEQHKLHGEHLFYLVEAKEPTEYWEEGGIRNYVESTATIASVLCKEDLLEFLVKVFNSEKDLPLHPRILDTLDYEDKYTGDYEVNEQILAPLGF